MGRSEKRKILVVDDEPYVRLLVKRFLGRDYDVIEASDGEQGVAMARSQKPDLIFMDILMPKMDGYTCCYEIKMDPATKAVPVVMVTAVGFELNIKLSKEMGAEGYITKPFSHSDLEAAIGKFLPGTDQSKGK